MHCELQWLVGNRSLFGVQTLTESASSNSTFVGDFSYDAQITKTNLFPIVKSGFLPCTEAVSLLQQPRVDCTLQPFSACHLLTLPHFLSNLFPALLSIKAQKSKENFQKINKKWVSRHLQLLTIQQKNM